MDSKTLIRTHLDEAHAMETALVTNLAAHIALTTDPDYRALLDKLNAAVNRAILEPKTKELLFTLGSEGGGGTPEEFAALIRRDSAKWAEVVKRSGAKID